VQSSDKYKYTYVIESMFLGGCEWYKPIAYLSNKLAYFIKERICTDDILWFDESHDAEAFMKEHKMSKKFWTIETEESIGDREWNFETIR
jgi:hypothetical protein